MKRRAFSLGLGALAASPVALRAQMKVPVEGREYRALDKRVPVDAPPDKLEVVDFFWYSCPHCNAFEPQLQAWINRLPPDVQLRRVPAAFREDMVPQQRLFYVLEAMGKLGDLHAKVFDAIHRQGLNLTQQQPITEWVAQQGVDAQKFTDLYKSFAITAKVRRAIDVGNLYGLEGVPAMGVAGRYYTDGTLVGNHTRMLQVVDYLSAEARKK